MAADFFTVEVWTRRGLQRFLVLFFIELSTRRVKIAGVAGQAKGLWMSQIARDIGDPIDGMLVGKRYLIHDCDPLFTAGLCWPPRAPTRSHSGQESGRVFGPHEVA